MPRLLLVDDEAMLLDLLRRYLERLGYEIDTAASPSVALAKFEKDPQGYDLVVTDLSFKDLDGEELLSRMRALNPHIRGILSSGFAHVPKLEGVEFLQKPFLPKMLAEMVDEALKTRR